MPYSLWIVPEGQVYKKIDRLIKDLVGKYNAPVFKPHMTLLGATLGGEKEIVKKTRKLAKSLQPFKLTLGEIDFSNTYFQSVFVRVKATAFLMKAYIKTQKLFNKDRNSLFMPHISLMYGDHVMSLREKIAKRIKLPKLSFMAKSIFVYETFLNVEPIEWKLVKAVNFAKKIC